MVTQHLTLRSCTLAHLTKLLDGADAFEAEFGFRVVEGYIEFPGALDFAAARLSSGEASAHWWAPFLFLHNPDRAVVGLGGFEGGPDATGAVELGYTIAPTYRGRGLATAAAGALVAHAFAFAEVCAVCAHTLPEANASARVLKKNGFVFAGERDHPEAGRLWRWERKR